MMNIVLWAIAVAVLAATALPLTNSVRWWVRMWEFPRIHIAVVAFSSVLLALPAAVHMKWVFLALMLGAIIYQVIHILPYTPLTKPEVDISQPVDAGDLVKVISANVLMENTRHADLLNILHREDPDVVLLMETDAVWANAVQDFLSRYSTVNRHISDDYYGMIFATRLESVKVDMLWPNQDTTPALKATLVAPNKTEFNFIGLHPRPPVPGNTTRVRDQQIKDAAKMTASSDRPTICMGDFNDVTWSWTTQRFKKYGGFSEPRVGRGMIASFHAKHWLMRFPIDQMYLTKSVRLAAFKRLEYFGSDHFPIMASVFFDTAAGEPQ